MPHTVLRAKLIADSDIGAIIGQRVRHMQLRQAGKDKTDDWGTIADDTTKAGITYQTISDTVVGGSTGGTETRRARIQLNLWAAKVDTVVTLYNHVTNKAKYNTWPDLTTDPQISSVHVENGSDLPEINIPGRDKAMAKGKRVDFILWYNAAP